MSTIIWLLLFAIAVAFAWLIRHNLRKWQARQRAEEERFASFMSGTAGAPAPTPATPPVPAALPSTASGNELAQQRLLFESAHKAGEAGEPALSIQLYSRLLVRYPATTFANPAREAMEAQKKRLLKERQVIASAAGLP